MADLRDEMKRSGRIYLSKSRLVLHYFFVPFLLVLPWLLTALTKPAFNNTWQNVNADADVWALTAGIVLSGLYAFRQYMGLNLKSVPLRISDEQLKKELHKLAERMHWILEYTADDVVIYSTAFKWSNWGTMVYIVRSDDKVSFKSICDLHNRPSTFSRGDNARNMRALDALLKQL